MADFEHLKRLCARRKQVGSALWIDGNKSSMNAKVEIDRIDGLIVEEVMKLYEKDDVVEVVRCKDCQYWRDAYVKENDGTERQYRDDDVDPLGMMGVTIDIGSNIWSMCLLENNCGWELNKSIFRNENDFCSRGEKRPCSYEKWWGISDGIYPKPDIKEG